MDPEYCTCNETPKKCATPDCNNADLVWDRIDANLVYEISIIGKYCRKCCNAYITIKRGMARLEMEANHGSTSSI